MSGMEDFGFFLTRTFATTKRKKREWPFVPGKYFVTDPQGAVAVTTLGSVALAREVAEAKPRGLCIVGKVETENIGIEKIIQNVLSNPAIRFLVCAGAEPPKHLTGASLLALFRNGIDERKRIIEAPGMRPMLPNTPPEEVELFRKRITPIDMVGCTDVAAISAKVEEIAAGAPEAATEPIELADRKLAGLARRDEVETIAAKGIDPTRVKLDKQGYFVVNIEAGRLLVEHYNYKEELLRVIEGKDARSIYFTLIENGWVTKLDHAAYLGKELARAELSLVHGFDFVQDGG